MTQTTPKCAWIDMGEDIWRTSCNNDFSLNDGTPFDNGMIFCCYCGKMIEEHANESEFENED